MQDSSGLEIDITTATMAYVGHTIEALFFDKNNLFHAFSQGRIDAVGNVHDSANDNQLYYSKAYILRKLCHKPQQPV